MLHLDPERSSREESREVPASGPKALINNNKSQSLDTLPITDGVNEIWSGDCV
jgi:hypothetical protein